MNRLVSPLAALALVAWPAAAWGADPQVMIDPSSPTGHEYAIPLERARAEAAGETARDRIAVTSARSSSQVVAPLFGEGIRKVSPSHRPARVGAGSRGTSRKVAPPVSAVPAAVLKAHPSGPGGVGWMALSAAAILGVGGAPPLLRRLLARRRS